MSELLGELNKVTNEEKVTTLNAVEKFKKYLTDNDFSGTVLDDTITEAFHDNIYDFISDAGIEIGDDDDDTLPELLDVLYEAYAKYLIGDK